jgi:hypothetical protein
MARYVHIYLVSKQGVSETSRKRIDKMENMIVLNTVRELCELINNTTMTTFVGRVAFAMDLLESVRHNDNMIEINHELGFCDDGGFIQIDEMGYVVDDYAIQ